METLRVIIIDDEQKSCEVLRVLIARYCPQVKIVASALGVSEAKAYIREHKPDLIFLDIEMPEGGGFKLLEDFEEPSFNVIFVTSYDYYALRAIKFSALDYLLKPVLVDELQRAVEKALVLKQQSVLLGVQLKILSSNLNAYSSPQKLFLNNKTKTNYVLIKDILYLRADVNYTLIYMADGQKHMIAKALKEYDDILCAPETGFLRIHKSSIINPFHVKAIVAGDPMLLAFAENTSLEVSRRKRKEVEEFMQRRDKFPKQDLSF
jgi:two-component system LytT family response regulator